MTLTATAYKHILLDEQGTAIVALLRSSAGNGC
jgi:hypothetical protein